MADSGIVHVVTGVPVLLSQYESQAHHALSSGTSFPASPVEKQLFYRTDLHKLYYYNGTTWVDMAGGGVTVHNDLTGRDAADCHPLAAITGLADHSARHEDGGADEISIAALSGEPAELTTHKNAPISPTVHPTPNLYIPGSNAQAIFQTASSPTSTFTALINAAGSGGLTTTNVPYDGDAGEVMLSAMWYSQMTSTKVILWNTTRGTSRVVTAIDTANNKMTTVASTDTWADNDALTMQSQTNAQAGYFDIDISALLTANTTGVVCWVQVLDSVAASAWVNFHPFIAFSIYKQISLAPNVNSTWTATMLIIPVISGKITLNWTASGAATLNLLMKYMGRIDSA
jgi:hypothetical protein